MTQESQTSGPHSGLVLWALSDGRAGNAAQALGLAEAVVRLRPASVAERHVAVKPWAARLPAAAWQALGRVAPGWPLAGLAEGAEGLTAPWPDLVIGAGRRVAPVAAWMRRVHGVRAVQILDPQMSPAAFDLVVAPAHDALQAPNAVATLGAIGRITPARIATEAERWRTRIASLPERRLAVLLGGPGRAADWGPQDAARIAAALAGLAAQGWTLLVTGSRRTDPALIETLAMTLDPERHLLHAGTGGDNPYPAILGLAEAVLVTEDSVNMASEAASTGLPLHILRVEHGSAKARAFHAALAAHGIARDFDGRIGAWSYTPLAEADRIARTVSARLFRH
jgi:hypothetical protein